MKKRAPAKIDKSMPPTKKGKGSANAHFFLASRGEERKGTYLYFGYSQKNLRISAHKKSDYMKFDYKGIPAPKPGSYFTVNLAKLDSKEYRELVKSWVAPYVIKRFRGNKGIKPGDPKIIDAMLDDLLGRLIPLRM